LILREQIRHSGSMSSFAHPLDPLSPAELAEVVEKARDVWALDHRHLIAMVQVQEPSKESVINFTAGIEFPRLVRMTIWDRSTETVYEGVLSVQGEAHSWKAISGAKSPVLREEGTQAIRAAKADPRVRAALLARGIIDPETVHMETWPIGAQIPAHFDDGRRLVWTPMWHRHTPDSNLYAHPIANLHAIVDLDEYEVIDVEDGPIIPIPQNPGHYRAAQTGGNIHLKELMIHQPEGASFTVEGWKIDWERWSFRIGFDQREGLVIHDVNFNDAGEKRRIAHRLSIAELVIPYGDPHQDAYRKNAFDTGEFGIGNCTNSLTLGCDCLGEIVYLDTAVVESDGNVREIPNAICLHEEDSGILWKHIDVDGHTEVRRGRRFVASSIVTINNYEYGYFWYFYQDGSIEFEAKLTGIVLTRADEAGTDDPWSTEIEPGLFAPFHQHIFVARLDMDVDGRQNSVVEVNAFAHPTGERNPYGGAYEITQTIFKDEASAQRRVEPMTSRYWKVINPNKRNHVGNSVGYKLVAGHTTFPLAQPDSLVGKRAGFMYNHLWVTPRKDEERYPAGDYPFQHPGGAGLPEWTSANRNIENTDVVLWYVFGANHIPRSEDWPVMPVERIGFHLKPVNFFSRSPGIDVAPSNPQTCH